MPVEGGKGGNGPDTYFLAVPGACYIPFYRGPVEDMEYMCLYTADGFEGEMADCNEGTLEWVKKEAVCGLNIWEGDKIFFRLLNENAPFFSLKLTYEGDRLIEAVLDGKALIA